MLKFLFYILIIWFLVRVISRFFMPRVQSRQRGRQSMLYQIISQLQNQSRNNGSGSTRQNGGQSGPKSGQQKSRSSKNKNLDDIEEAEFEDITDDDQK